MPTVNLSLKSAEAHKCGIYLITNTITKRVYVGQTERYFSVRWKDHRKNLKSGCHKNPHLQSSYNKHGEDSFKYEILETCNVEQLTAYEAKYLEYFRSRPAGVFNMREAGPSGSFNEETKEKMAAAKKGRPRAYKDPRVRVPKGKAPSDCPQYRFVKKHPVVGVEVNTGEIIEFESGKAAIRAGFTHVLSSVKKGWICHGYKFRYKETL